MSDKNKQAAAIKDLWTVLEEEAAIFKSSANFDAQCGNGTTLVFLGPKSCGKTTLINKFLDKGNRTDSPADATIGLDYTFGRRVRASSNVKDVVHLWDVSGGDSMTKLLEVPISSSSVHTTSCILCLDLSKPRELISALDHYVTALRTHVNEILTNLEKRGSKRPKGMRQMVIKRYPTDCKDQSELNLIPIQWALIATKYDLFQSHPPELKRLMVKLLRYYAHVYGGTFLMTSDRAEDVFMVRTKQLLSHYGFKTVHPKASTKGDGDRPLHIISGTDSMQDIFSDLSCPSLKELTNQFSAFLSRLNDSDSVLPNVTEACLTQHKAFSPQFAEPLIDQECIF